MKKREIIAQLKKHMETMHKQILQNLLESWTGRTPKLWCEPHLADCIDCRFLKERICDMKDCDDRFIFDDKGEL